MNVTLGDFAEITENRVGVLEAITETNGQPSRVADEAGKSRSAVTRPLQRLADIGSDAE